MKVAEVMLMVKFICRKCGRKVVYKERMVKGCKEYEIPKDVKNTKFLWGDKDSYMKECFEYCVDCLCLIRRYDDVMI